MPIEDLYQIQLVSGLAGMTFLFAVTGIFKTREYFLRKEMSNSETPNDKFRRFDREMKWRMQEAERNNDERYAYVFR